MAADYYKVRIICTPCTDDITDLVATYLVDCGFETFDADAEGLDAYIPAGSMTPASVEDITSEALEDFPISTVFVIKAEFVPGQNWNEEWEKHYFQPIVIEDECVVHSSFHTDIPAARYDIVIDPKMAFGTGHHHTTSRMAAWLLEENLSGKSLIDMGTGTGILSILAAMRGATPVTGIEIDPGAFENAVENVALNDCSAQMLCGDAALLRDIAPADFFLANINRNIILEDLPHYAEALKEGGVMLLSGFYDHDLPVVEEAAAKYRLKLTGTKESDHWVAARFNKL